MSDWNPDYHRSAGDDVENLAYPPSGGRVKQWLAGALVPGWLIYYGITSLEAGKTFWFGNHGGAYLAGRAAEGASWAYIAIGAFLHFHYFWGLNDHLWRWSQPLKTVALLGIVFSIGKMLFWMFA